MRLVLLLGLILIVNSFCQADLLENPAPSGQSITYEESVKKGLEQNLDILAQKFNIPLSQAAALLAGALANPFVQLDTQLMPFGPNWNQTSTGGPAQQDILFNFPIDVTQKRSKSEAAANYSTLATEAQFQSFLLQKKSEIQISYVNLTSLQSLVELLAERQEAFERIEHAIENRIGSARLLPQLQERVRLAAVQSRFELQSRKVELEQQSISISVLLGFDNLSGNLRASTSIQEFPKQLKVIDLNQLIDHAKESRPDLKAIKFQRTQADWELKSARARILDDFTLILGSSRQDIVGANPYFTGPNPGNPAIAPAWSWFAGVIIPFPIFSQNSGGIKRAYLLQDQADAKIRALELQIRSEARIALKALEVTSTQIQEYEGSTLGGARRVRDGVQKLFGTGAVNFLEYLDAMNTYNSIVSSYIQTLADHRRAIIRLNLSIGATIFQ